MEVWNEPAVLFEKSTMFTKSRFCKIYKVTSENPSGYLPHSHDYMQIWYITRGCCEHWVEGQKHLMARGDIFIVPPKVEHQVVRLEDAEIISCEFSFDHFFPPKENSAYQQVHEAALNLSFAWLFLKDADDIHSQFSLRPETGERVNTLMNAMLVEYENGDIYYEEFLRVQIMELLLVLAREYSQSPQSHTAAAVYDNTSLWWKMPSGMWKRITTSRSSWRMCAVSPWCPKHISAICSSCSPSRPWWSIL